MKAWKTSTAVLELLALACAAALSGGALAQTSSVGAAGAPSAGQALASTYTEPATADLVPVSTFSVVTHVDSVAPGVRRLTYDLPADLVGPEPLTIAVTEQAGVSTDGLNIPFNGALADAMCNQQDDGSLLCLMAYHHAVNDLVGARQAAIATYLSARTASPTELAQRLKVATLFSTEPAGFLVVGAPDAAPLPLPL